MRLALPLKILIEHNMDKNEYYAYKSVGALFQLKAKQYGEKTLFRFKDNDSDAWNDLSWNMVANDVNLVSCALLAIGCGEKEIVGICSPNYHYWTITDYAIYGFRGISVPIYPTSSPSQIKYIVDETNMRFLFVGNQDQYDKAISIESSLEKIIVFDSSTDLKNDDRALYFNDLLKIGEENREAYSQVVEDYLANATKDDVATIIYTSGTTGEPKGAILKNTNFFFAFYLHDIRVKVGDTDTSITFLPLSHVYERSWGYYIMYKGSVIVFMDDPKNILSMLKEVKPTMLCTVPRFYEKIYEGIWDKVSSWSKTKQNIVKWAITVGKKYSYRKKEGKVIYIGLLLKQRIAKKLVFDKINSVLGGNLRLSPCGGAALSPKIVEFFHSIGLMINHGYGLTETTATVSCYETQGYEYDSVGKIMPDVEVLINEDNEILIKGDSVFHGYYKKEDATNEAFDGGWFKTGDAGILTEKGNLRITDRIKDIIKTSGGKYVAPQMLEGMLSHSSFINQTAVVGNKRKYISALIVPEFSKLRQWAADNGISYSDNIDLVNNEKVVDLFQTEINDHCKDLAPFERIIRFTLLGKEFTLESGEITATLKIRRKAINMIYAKEIENMYS